MSPIRSHVTKVRRLFGPWADHVSRLALRDQRFRSMCDDYGMTIETLDVLERRNHPADAKKLVEYRALRRELEHDLERELLASSNSKSDD